MIRVTLVGLAMSLGGSSPSTPPVQPDEPVMLVSVRLASCVYEDGSGGPLPCVWDGRHDGNGDGLSYIVHRDETITYITHRRAHNLSR